MSIKPFRHKITLYQGATFTQRWTFYLDAARTQPRDFTDWSAVFTVKKDRDPASPVLLQLSSADTPSPSQSGITMGADGVIEAYGTDEDLAAIAAAAFEFNADEQRYEGTFDLEVEEPDGERHRYAMGEIVFSPEVD